MHRSSLTQLNDADPSAVQVTFAAWIVLQIFGADVEIAGEVTSPPGTVSLKVDLGSIPVGQALAQLVRWAQPGRTVNFDPPWDRLLDLTLPPITFQLTSTPAKGAEDVIADPQAKTTFAISATGFNIDFSPFLTLDALTLAYTPTPRAVDFRITGTFLGQAFPQDRPLSWDVLNSRPPAVPSAAGKVFELRYLGVGQRIKVKAPTPESASTELEPRNPTLWDVIHSLEQAYTKDGPPIGGAIDFADDGGWLVGVDFTLAGMLTVAALFDDPTMYGLHLALDGPKARSAAGLSFDILYRKVNDNLGVYHAELVLPNALRHIELGPVSITLPVIALDVYTNGDFLVDIGFPYQLNFSRSFTIQILPFVGAGGFYFGMLSQSSATALPSPATGSFAPVVVFGLGLQIGIGKTFSCGPFSGGITVTVTGSIEGLIAGWRPAAGGNVADVYYKITGQVLISGHLYAAIDFAIIKASIDIYAFAGAALVMESYQPTHVTLSAGVKISVSVKIVFFTIHLSFSATIRESFQIGSASTPPWDAEGARSQILYARVQRRLNSASPPHVPAGWESVDLVAAGVHDIRTTVTLGIIPVATFGEPAGDPTAASAQLVALGLTDAPMPHAPSRSDASRPTSFDALTGALFAWAMQLAAQNAQTVTQAAVQTLFDELAKPEGDGGMPTETVLQFLVDNIHFEIVDASSWATQDKSLTVFPMLPWLALSTAADRGYSVDFAVHNPASASYRDKLARYFAELDPSTDGPSGLNRRELPDGADALPGSLTAVLTADCCKLILRGLLGDALQHFKAFTRPAAATDPPRDFLTWLVDRYGLGPTGLVDLAEANRSNADLLGTYMIVGGQAQPHAGESPVAFCERVGLSLAELTGAAADEPGFIDPAAGVKVTGGSYVILDADVATLVTGSWVPVATDLLSLLARRFAVDPAALHAANPNLEPAQWTSAGAGAPHTPAPLKAGDTVILPTLETAAGLRTLQALATEYRLTPDIVLAANATNTALLAQSFSLALPAFSFKANGATPLQIAQRFGLTVAELIIANDTPKVPFGPVVIPAVAQIPVEELSAGVLSESSVTTAAGSVARFLLHGLRLPAPAGDGLGPLGALYELTGQQFSAPKTPAGAGVVLTPTPTTGLATPQITFPSKHRLEVPLDSDTIGTIDFYRTQLPAPPFDPAILSATRYPPYAVVPRRYTMGQPRTWQRPVPWRGAGGGALPKLYGLPISLLNDLGTADAGFVALTLTDPGVAGAGGSTTPVEDARWAAVADFLIRRVPAPGDANTYIPGMYELVSSVGDASTELLALRHWLEAHPHGSASLELLYSASGQANDNSGVRSDVIAAANVSLVKANLSTVTAKPAGHQALASDSTAPLIDATMDQPAFIQLLWESSTVNAGGYFLQYGRGSGPRLPDILFESSPLATLTVVALTEDPDEIQPAPLRPFHNAVISTVDANSSKVTVDVEPHQRAVPTTATTLTAAAASFDVSVPDFGAANATNSVLLRSGTHVANPLLPEGSYTIQAGDDLLTLAVLMGVPVEAAAQQLADVATLLAEPTTAWRQIAFVTRSSSLPAGLAGFRLTRQSPDPGSSEGEVGGQAASPAVALATSYHLLSYSVVAAGGFAASNDAMPLAPLSPGRDVWRYQQSLPVASLLPGGTSPYAATSPYMSTSPYTAVGHTATVAFALQDLYGNRALPAGTPAELPVPVFYDDQLLPIASWPKAQVQFEPGISGSGKLILTLTLDVASTVTIASSDPSSVATHAEHEFPRYALAQAQLDRPDVTVTAATSLSPDPASLCSKPLLAFTRAAHDYLVALSAVRALTVVGKGKTLGVAASSVGTTPAGLATANQDIEAILAHGATLTLPRLAAVVLGDSLTSIATRFSAPSAPVTPTQLGAWNATVALAVDLKVTVDGSAYRTKAGDTLESLAPGAPGQLAEANSTVVGLFPQGTTIVASTRAEMYIGDTLRLLAADAGATVAILAELNSDAPLADTSALVMPGRLDPSAVTGPETATHRVAVGETLGGVAGTVKLAGTDLVLANAWSDGVLELGVSLSYASQTVKVVTGDTMQSVAARFATLKVEVDAPTLFLDAANDRPGVLHAGAMLLLPPASVTFPLTIAPSLNGSSIAPLTVTTTITRTANVDPQLAATAGVGSTTSPVTARLPGTDTRAVTDFAERFEAAFATWHLALATSTGNQNSPDKSPSFYVVQITPDWDGEGTPKGIAYHFDDAQVTFSIPPVATQPWSSTGPVGVADYSSGSGLGPDVATRVSGVDLEAIQVRAIADLDRFLEPGSTLAAYAYAPQSVRDVVTAKHSLAASVSKQLTRVLVPRAGDWTGDIDAARESMRQMMLVQASQAYTTDALVQIRAQVSAPDAAKLRARLNGIPAPVAPPQLPNGARALGRQHWTARGHEHLRMLMSALGGSFREPNDRASFAALNQDASLAAGQHVLLGTRSHTVVEGESLKDVADAFDVPVADLVNASPDILAARGSAWSFEGAEPPLTITPAKLTLFRSGETALTFALHTASLQQHRNVAPELVYHPTELEYGVTEIEGGYESSHWLSFVTTRAQSALGRSTIPLPLRVFPATPRIVDQTTCQHGTTPVWETLGDGQFSFTYDYAEADQDTVTVGVERVHGGDGKRTRISDEDPLAVALVRYQAVADALWADLAPLSSTAGDPGSLLAGRCTIAARVFAQLIDAIAAAWKGRTSSTSSASASASASDRAQLRATSGQRITTVTRPDGRRRVTLHPPAAGAPGLRLSGGRLLAHGPEQTLSNRGRDRVQLAPMSFTVPTDQQLWGVVDVVRNTELVPDRTTAGAFEYRLLNTRASAPALPLVSYTRDLDLRAVPYPPFPGTKMVDHVRNMLAAALDLGPGSGVPSCFVSVTAAWEFGYGTVPPIDAGDVHAVPAPAYAGYAHQFDPLVDFGESVGYSAELATKLLDWQSRNQPPIAPAQWCFSLTAYSALDLTAPPGLPLLEVARVILPLSAVSETPTA